MAGHSEHFDVVVVGAGWTGLISAQTYLKLSPNANLRILDAGKSIGGVWSAEKVYPDLYAQIAHPLFEYSSYRMPAEGLSPDGYISGKTIHNYLKDFAHDFGLDKRLKLETAVTKVERTSSGGWLLEATKGPRLTCDKLIWAVGGTSCPVLPSWPSNDFTSPIIHSNQIGEQLSAIQDTDSAVVIGAAKSAWDAVYMLLKKGKKVDWLIREDGTGPLAMAAPTFFGIWNIVDVIACRGVSAFSPSIFETSGWMYEAINKTRLGRFTTKAIWWTVEQYSSWVAGYSKDENFGKLRPEPHGYGVFWAKAGLGATSAPNFWQVLHEGDLTVHRDEIKSLSNKDQVHLKSGKTIQSDIIVSCTGYEKPYRSFSPELRIDLGLEYGKHDADKWAKYEAEGEVEVDRLLPILKEFSPEANGFKAPPKDVHDHLHGPSRHYRRIVPPGHAAANDRSIIFPGMVHSIFTPLLAEAQALWGCAYLLDLLDLPNEHEMNKEVALFNVWTRKRYLAQGRKHAYAMFDFLSYIDVLCKDLGIKTQRKGNWFTELFTRYKPQDYEGMIEEFAVSARSHGKQISL